MHENFYFAMNDRVSNINKLPFYIIVKMECSQLYSTTGYRDKHDVIKIVARARRIVAHELSIFLGFSERFFCSWQQCI